MRIGQIALGLTLPIGGIVAHSAAYTEEYRGTWEHQMAYRRSFARHDGHAALGYVFTTERGTSFTPDAINRQIKTIGQRAGLALPVHFHMLRHSCGYKLANDGIDTRAIQDWLGHVSITHTTRYTALSQTRFKDFWRD